VDFTTLRGFDLADELHIPYVVNVPSMLVTAVVHTNLNVPFPGNPFPLGTVVSVFRADFVDMSWIQRVFNHLVPHIGAYVLLGGFDEWNQVTK
jgi:hypothetical protein